MSRHRGFRADRHDPIACNCDRFGDREGGIDGYDFAVFENEIGRPDDRVGGRAWRRRLRRGHGKSRAKSRDRRASNGPFQEISAWGGFGRHDCLRANSLAGGSGEPIGLSWTSPYVRLLGRF
jgi:hypothetical protein